jgi:preprotein translocase subunit SecG
MVDVVIEVGVVLIVLMIRSCSDDSSSSGGNFNREMRTI